MFSLISVFAQPNTLWTQTFGGSSADYGMSVQQTTDGGYIIAGFTNSYGAGSDDVYLIKTNYLGVEEWPPPPVTFGGSANDHGYSVQQTTDGGYIIAGMTGSYGAGSADVYLIKTYADGSEEWPQPVSFGGSENDYGLSVQQTSNGGYIIAGWTESYPAVSADVYLIKTYADGSEEWPQPVTFGGNNVDLGHSVQQTSEGGYIIAGETHGLAVGTMDAWLIKTDANGDSLWTRTFGENDADEATSVQQTADGGYILAGYTGTYASPTSYDYYIVKTDWDGIEEWHTI